MWFCEYFWIISLYGHLVYFILKVLVWEICNMKWGFAQKVIIKSQRQFMYGSNFYGSDVTSKCYSHFCVSFSCLSNLSQRSEDKKYLFDGLMTYFIQFIYKRYMSISDPKWDPLFPPLHCVLKWGFTRTFPGNQDATL